MLSTWEATSGIVSSFRPPSSRQASLIWMELAEDHHDDVWLEDWPCEEKLMEPSSAWGQGDPGATSQQHPVPVGKHWISTKQAESGSSW